MAFSPRSRKRVVPAIDSAILSSDMSFHQKTDSDFESPRNSERNDTDGSLQDEHPIEIAAKENKQVFYSRYLMLFVLACSAMAVAFLTYKLVTDEELEDFESQFVNDAQELIDACESNESNIVSVLTIFSTLFSSAAKHDAATWPFFTLPDFEKFGSGARRLSGATLLAFTPLVNDVDRALRGGDRIDPVVRGFAHCQSHRVLFGQGEFDKGAKLLVTVAFDLDVAR